MSRARDAARAAVQLLTRRYLNPNHHQSRNQQTKQSQVYHSTFPFILKALALNAACKLKTPCLNGIRRLRPLIALQAVAQKNAKRILSGTPANSNQQSLESRKITFKAKFHRLCI